MSTKKKRCPNCNKKTGLLTYDCKFCNKDYCISCRDVIVHRCENAQDCKRMKREQLKDKLNSERIISEKVIKI